jgi:hypothetical protein
MCGMKNAISIMLTLQILCASLSATAHAAFVSHIDHEVGHPLVHHDSEVNSKVTEGGVESDAYDATNHTHLSLDILIAPHSYAIAPLKIHG